MGAFDKIGRGVSFKTLRPGFSVVFILTWSKERHGSNFRPVSDATAGGWYGFTSRPANTCALVGEWLISVGLKVGADGTCYKANEGDPDR
ncbi:hypothetical protein [Loktanella sp. R86503]|uniref:hypothetical protein n=1 Tax=Loktanella sp. R86503 TaxID=3093847 RepID=UPI0036DE4E78